MGRKIARPMVHASWSLGSASKLEGVFVPVFQGHRYSLDPGDRWFPTVISTDRSADMIEGITSRINTADPALVTPGYTPKYVNYLKEKAMAEGRQAIVAKLKDTQFSGFDNLIPTDINGLGYAQGGLRFSTTAGPADIGAQYYSGYFFRPSMVIDAAAEFIDTVNQNPAAADPTSLSPRMRYNRYHQIGVDYTQVIFDMSVRAEAAVNITGDTKGDDGSVYNPSLAWSLGFDRDLFGFTLLVEADESIRLLDDKVGDNPAMDTEADSPITNTAITTRISRAFFQDKLELKFSILWNIEASDVYLMPSMTYTMGDLQATLAGGIFAGKPGGELSQYWNNGYIRTALTYSF
jgi:hypothetical protein